MADAPTCGSTHEQEAPTPKESKKILRLTMMTYTCSLPKGHKGLCSDSTGRIKWRKKKIIPKDKKIHATRNIDLQSKRDL